VDRDFGTARINNTWNRSSTHAHRIPIAPLACCMLLAACSLYATMPGSAQRVPRDGWISRWHLMWLALTGIPPCIL
jgi:hypothetical protein